MPGPRASFLGFRLYVNVNRRVSGMWESQEGSRPYRSSRTASVL